MSFSLEKEKAVTLLGSGVKWTDSKLSKELGVSRGTVQSWKQDPNFRSAVVSEFERVCKQDQLYRVKEIRKILKPIYKELRRRIRTNDLRNMSFKDLTITLSRLQAELRNDLERLNIISKASSAGKSDSENGSDNESANSKEEVLDGLSGFYLKNREEEKYVQ